MKPKTRTNKTMKVPIEFDGMISKLALDEARQSGDIPSKARVMRLMAAQYKDKLVFRGKKIDIRLL